MWLQQSQLLQHIMSWYGSWCPQTQLTSMLMYLNVLPTICRLLEAVGNSVSTILKDNHNVMNHRDNHNVMNCCSTEQSIAIIIPRKMIPHGVYLCKSQFRQVITTNIMVGIRNGHHSTFSWSCLLLHRNSRQLQVCHSPLHLDKSGWSAAPGFSAAFRWIYCRTRVHHHWYTKLLPSAPVRTQNETAGL